MNPHDLPPQARGLAPDAAWSALIDGASACYRGSSRWAYHWARGKLSRDPVFRGLLERGDIPARSRVVDIGCGQGLIAALLRASAQLQAAGRWPALWPAQASALAYTGIELMPKDVARAQAALGALTDGGFTPRFVGGDMRQVPFPACDVVVILDVLHYVDHAAQDAVLARVRDALQPTGRLLLRVGDAASAGGFAASQWVDRLVTWARGHTVPPTFGRPLAEWTALLQRLGFAVRAIPQSQGTPFANVLLVADLQPAPEGALPHDPSRPA